MEPNTTSKAHEHTGPEEFFILEGDLTDPMDIIIRKVILFNYLQDHHITVSTKTGCTAVVTHRGKFIYSE